MHLVPADKQEHCSGQGPPGLPFQTALERQAPLHACLAPPVSEHVGHLTAVEINTALFAWRCHSDMTLLLRNHCNKLEACKEPSPDWGVEMTLVVDAKLI